MQRMVMVTSILSAAGPHGRPALELAEAIGFRGTDESKREQLARLVRDLQVVGVDVANAAELGQEARWVLRRGDSRIRLAFSPEQLAELARAALLADRGAHAWDLGTGGAAPTDLEVRCRGFPWTSTWSCGLSPPDASCGSATTASPASSIR